MSRYANLIDLALNRYSDIRVERVCVSPSLHKFPQRLRTPLHHLLAFADAKRIASQIEADVVHIIDGSHGYLTSAFPQHRVVATVHDMIPKLQSLQKFSVPKPNKVSRIIINAAFRGLANADQLIFDSHQTGRDYRSLQKHRTSCDSVIAPPLEDIFYQPAARSAAAPFDQDYVFHIGNNGFYKNREGVIRIFAKIQAQLDHHLVMAGPAPTRDLNELVQRFGIEGRIHFVCDPTDMEIRQLYQHAAAFLFPSLYEGFGWPPIEAMACGCPVICSDCGSLAEIDRNAAKVIASGNETEMSESLMQLLLNSRERERLIARGREYAQRFTLERFADSLQKVYRSAIRVRLVPTTVRRPYTYRIPSPRPCVSPSIV
ncbi:glycosyltransferase family 4 protein [Stieleria sp. JC731]|uniref:glycosyltransferase family 4 protein n=1 Tax=Pirellulaceae TaxID=2691357 RepID=UPI001E5AEAE5|nr:glycosyltransferase family 1 protein [Stieleria sp. JC731]MCC9601223.1 glycosyltransferase family 4 protein [Stieleria sp. JC731]